MGGQTTYAPYILYSDDEIAKIIYKASNPCQIQIKIRQK